MTTVTPPLRSIGEPPAPRHGPKYDTNEPYLRRRSSRLRSHRTPSPSRSAGTSDHKSSAHRPQTYQYGLSPPSSPLSPNNRSVRRQTRRDMETTLGEHSLVYKSTERMLPTPVKTPSKKELKSNTKAASRVLFPQSLRNHPEDITPQRNRISLYSPGATPAVEIFTDMNARVPELDETEENVFYDTPQKRSAKAKSRAKDLKATEEKRKELDQKKDSEKGMWFTFRGKKVWREYEADKQDEYPQNDDTTGIPPRTVTPPPRFTKTAYKPRTLFPEVYKKGDTTDEEAVTDIENPELYSHTVSDKPAATPVKQRFYATPPTTARTTRSTAKRPAEETASDQDELSTSLFAVKKGKKTSPFNEWTRVKGDSSSSSSSQEKKRKSDQMHDSGPSKRVKSDVVE